MHRNAKSQSLFASRSCPCSDDVAMRAKGGSVPRLMLRIPGIKAVMMISERNEDLCASLLVARDQFVGLPVQQRPLCAEVLVAEPRLRSVMIQVILVLRLPFQIHTARVPVAVFRHALRAPVCPDAELCVLVPLWCFVLQ